MPLAGRRVSARLRRLVRVALRLLLVTCYLSILELSSTFYLCRRHLFCLLVCSLLKLSTADLMPLLPLVVSLVDIFINDC